MMTDAVREAAKMARDFIASTNNETGCCMCGSPVDGHGFGDGHSPVDEGSYYANHVIEVLDAALDSRAGDAGEAVAYAPKGHIERYLKGRNTGCWVYGSPTADDNDVLYRAAATPASHASDGGKA